MISTLWTFYKGIYFIYVFDFFFGENYAKFPQEVKNIRNLVNPFIHFMEKSLTNYCRLHMLKYHAIRARFPCYHCLLNGNATYYYKANAYTLDSWVLRHFVTQKSMILTHLIVDDDVLMQNPKPVSWVLIAKYTSYDETNQQRNCYLRWGHKYCLMYKLLEH